MNTIDKKPNYNYAVFLSYRRNSPVEKWVKEYFYPTLQIWLPEELPSTFNSKIFIDENIKTGQKWPDELKKAIMSTRIFLPVLSSPYFNSAWCLAELNTILARIEMEKLCCTNLTDGIIYPIIFGDGIFFPDTIKEIKYRDMKKWATIAQYFRKSKGFMSFEKEVKIIANDIAKMLLSKDFPPFNPNWPIVEVLEDKDPVPIKFSNLNLGIRP